jgi:hypothetical protein
MIWIQTCTNGHCESSTSSPYLFVISCVLFALLSALTMFGRFGRGTGGKTGRSALLSSVLLLEVFLAGCVGLYIAAARWPVYALIGTGLFLGTALMTYGFWPDVFGPNANPLPGIALMSLMTVVPLLLIVWFATNHIDGLAAIRAHIAPLR